jgi:hypothetical protein
VISASEQAINATAANSANASLLRMACMSGLRREESALSWARHGSYKYGCAQPEPAG